MRKLTLLLGTLLFVALAGTAGAQCYDCDVPCYGPAGPGYECNWMPGSGYMGDCWNIGDCEGCNGWFDQGCIWFGDQQLQPKEPAPLLGVSRVTSVVVRHDPTPVRRPEPVRIALAQ